MTVLTSAINHNGPEFRENADAMAALVDDLREKSAGIAQGGGERTRDKHLARGKLLPRDRV